MFYFVTTTTAAVTLALALSAAPSFANRSAADACAAKLSSDAKLIYASTIGAVAPGVDMVETVRAKTRELAMAGKINRSLAQPAAQAAGECLKQAL
jgi:hypothetical protein